MDAEQYKQQLYQINIILEQCIDDAEKQELLSLKSNIEELLSLTEHETNTTDDEYALFMAEMQKEGATTSVNEEIKNIDHLKATMEGKKYKAPHTHSWGQTVYHNAVVCSILNSAEVKARVLFLNPTHEEMLPCPYYFDTEKDCRFSEEKCKYSHGEIVPLSSLQVYVEPEFEKLTIGSKVLAKHSNNLWYRAKIKSIFHDKCSVQFESDDKRHLTEIEFDHIIPLNNNGHEEDSGESSNEDDNSDSITTTMEDVINFSLLNNDGLKDGLGNWEKYTKGIGSKLMQKMGYVVGSGLGKDSTGRVEPVTAIILPQGKSLDHCMQLREKYGGDKNFFSAEKKMKRLQKRAEKISQKNYERESNKTDVFSFINNAITKNDKMERSSTSNNHGKTDFQMQLKTESPKSLNITELKIYEDIKKTEKVIEEYKIALQRQQDPSCKNAVLEKIRNKNSELDILKSKALSIKNEQQFRSDHKKMTVF